MAINIAVPSTETVAFSEQDAKVARMWAIDKGHTVPARGRLSGELMLAWHFDGRPHYETEPVKFSVPRGEGKVFRSWAEANGYEADSDAYKVWAESGKPEPEGYWSADTLATVDIEQDGTVTTVPVSKDRMAEIRGGRTGKPKSAEYLSAADIPEDATPVRIVTRNGAVHTVDIATEDDTSEDQALGYVIRWQTKRDGNAQMAAQVDALTEQVSELITERDDLLAQVAELSKTKRTTRARKPATATTDSDA